MKRLKTPKPYIRRAQTLGSLDDVIQWANGIDEKMQEIIASLGDVGRRADEVGGRLPAEPTSAGSQIRNPRIDGAMAWSERTPAALGSDQNNYDPGNVMALRLSSSAGRNVTGFSGGRQGRPLLVINSNAAGGASITLVHLSGSSSAANQILSGTGVNIALGPNDAAILYYDSTTQKWRPFGIVT